MAAPDPVIEVPDLAGLDPIARLPVTTALAILTVLPDTLNGTTFPLPVYTLKVSALMMKLLAPPPLLISYPVIAPLLSMVTPYLALTPLILLLKLVILVACVPTVDCNVCTLDDKLEVLLETAVLT
jgi:hypothetical protein